MKWLHNITKGEKWTLLKIIPQLRLCRRLLLLAALVLSFSFSSCASAFFGNPCLLSPYNYIRCYGENPGSVRTDIGNEILSIAREIWKVKSMLTSLKAPDFGQFLKLGFNLDRPGQSLPFTPYEEVREGAVNRNKLFTTEEDKRDIVSFEDGGKREFLPVAVQTMMNTPTLRAEFAARLGNDIAGMEGINNLITGTYDRKQENKLLTEGRKNDGDMEQSILKILEKLGLGASELAIVRDIAQNLAKYNLELNRTALIQKELSDVRAENNIQLGKLAQMTGGLYGYSIEQSVRERLDR